MAEVNESEETIYDRVRYPSLVFPQTDPERLAVLGRLAGLDPVPPREARILEVGGGDCLNLLTYAVAYPGATACGFDLSRAAIADGQATAAGAGLANAELVVEDILHARERYAPRSFDYVIVHGVYAWVPDHVREATMALVGHVLSERGIAFISYNLSAGGHVRTFFREAFIEILRGKDDPIERLEAARAYLAEFAQPREGDPLLIKALREQANLLFNKIPDVLFHDELTDHYNPQSLRQLCEAASAQGLRLLTDAGPQRGFDGFLPEGIEPEGDPDSQILDRLQRFDIANARFFRQSLLVRAEQPIDRRLDPARIEGMFVSARLKRSENGDLVGAEGAVTLMDDALAQRLADLGMRYPERVSVAELACADDHRKALLQLYGGWLINLHLEPLTHPVVATDRPTASGLVRQRIREQREVVPTLDYKLIQLAQPELRALLLAADGTHSLAELAQLGHGIPPGEVADALAAAARLGLMTG